MQTVERQWSRSKQSAAVATRIESFLPIPPCLAESGPVCHNRTPIGPEACEA